MKILVFLLCFVCCVNTNIITIICNDQVYIVSSETNIDIRGLKIADYMKERGVSNKFFRVDFNQ